jgi:hypothetical protein
LWGRVGDTLLVPGGEISEQLVQAQVGSEMTQKCVGPYWIVSP